MNHARVNYNADIQCNALRQMTGKLIDLQVFERTTKS